MALPRKLDPSKISGYTVFVFSICTIYLVSGEQVYIVTSPASPCPTREQGEPCLTLEQYTTNPSQSSNVTLVLESGNHVFEQSIPLTGSNNFSIISEGAKIIFQNHAEVTIHQDYVKLSGITFSSNPRYYVYIRFDYLQELVVQDCNFQGVRVSMSSKSAAFLRCTFSNCYYGRYQRALYISYSSNVSVVQSNFTNNRGAIGLQFSRYYYASTSLTVIKCNFINNTSEDYIGGGAIYVSGIYFSVTVNQSTFIYNTVSKYYHEGFVVYGASRNQGGGGAINFDGTCTNCIISESIFISNSAQYCGALSAGMFDESNDIDISITDSAFYYNRADSEVGIGGGAACINDAFASITNCTFVGNTAAGLGGAVVSDNSTIDIIDTVFSNNTAGFSGGALITYASPSNYTISSSIFIDNQAGDDGGALFIGRTGSSVIVEESNILQNHAANRGGAFSVFGSSMTIYHGTNIYDNTADLGKAISSCSSEISLPIEISKQADPNFLSCTAYNNDIRFSTPTFQELHSYQNVTLAVNAIISDYDIFSNPTVSVKGTESLESINSKLHQMTVVVYISLTLSIILTVLFAIAALVVYRKFRLCHTTRSALPHRAHNRTEPVYEDMLECNSTDTEDIQMKKNILYKKP